MKNSTLVIILFIASIFGVLSYIYPIVTFQVLAALLLAYLFVCLVEYCDRDEYVSFIKWKYNILRIITGSVSNFFKWLDSKPTLIKSSKNSWRVPEDWNNEV